MFPATGAVPSVSMGVVSVRQFKLCPLILLCMRDNEQAIPVYSSTNDL